MAFCKCSNLYLRLFRVFVAAGKDEANEDVDELDKGDDDCLDELEVMLGLAFIVDEFICI